jgi:outer membrane protein OmpA-like peptidoglycan-associated protein
MNTILITKWRWFYQAILLLVFTSFIIQGCGLVNKMNQPKLPGVKIQQTERGLVLTFNHELLFEDFEHHKIKPGQEINLDKLAKFIKRDPSTQVLIESHTDSTGEHQYNFHLSQTRADSVRAFLIQRSVDPMQIKAFGYGENEPIASNDTAKGRHLNRRLEVIILDHQDEKKDEKNEIQPFLAMNPS